MVFWNNYEKAQCLFCKRWISKTNRSKHGPACWPKYIVVMLAVYGHRWVPEGLKSELEAQGQISEL